MADKGIALMAHLMRRASFGATREELEKRVAKGYEATVEELLHPEDYSAVDTHVLYRYAPRSWGPGMVGQMGIYNWMYHILNTERPLEEKMVLFWHQVFATGNNKVDNYDQMLVQIGMFRRQGMGNFRDLLLELARNPAMIFWLDNNENHKYAVNENWGRELLELFSLGVGNYTEGDVREASRAFTGWTIAAKIPRFPYYSFPWNFEYKVEDHDYGDKSFLGHQGCLNGEDIIDIIVQQPASARFIARHLYNFFVDDEPQVPSWVIEPPGNPEAVDTLATALTESKYEMRPVLRTLFNSDFFKEATFARVKSPTEVVAGTLKLLGGYNFPTPTLEELCMEPANMGQDMLNPPSVEGWHTGQEWINSGSLMNRVNFVADMVANTSLPGVQSIINRLRAQGDLSPEALVDGCLDLLGPLEMEPQTRQHLIAQAEEGGVLRWDSENGDGASAQRVGQVMQLIVATREYQFG